MKNKLFDLGSGYCMRVYFTEYGLYKISLMEDTSYDASGRPIPPSSLCIVGKEEIDKLRTSLNEVIEGVHG